MKSARDVKAALVALLPTLYPATTLVTYGLPGAYLPDSIVYVGDQRFDTTKPTMGTNRSREEIVETEIVFSIFVPGDVEAQKTATDTAYTLALTLDDYLRVKPNETLSGACREAWISGGSLEETKAAPSESGSMGVAGRVSTLTTILTTTARRTP